MPKKYTKFKQGTVLYKYSDIICKSRTILDDYLNEKNLENILPVFDPQFLHH